MDEFWDLNVVLYAEIYSNQIKKDKIKSYE